MSVYTIVFTETNDSLHGECSTITIGKGHLSGVHSVLCMAEDL